MTIIIVGCGFLGEVAADLFSGDGERVLGLCASEASARRLGGRGFEMAAMDIAESPVFSRQWSAPDVLVHCASSGGGGVAAYERVYREGLRSLLAATRPKAVIFVSSTSVYAQGDGGVVEECSAAEPVVATGRILREAEEMALSCAGGCVLRLGALYGPGRSVLLRRYLEGSARIEEGRWINQIHRDDAARALVHAARRSLTGIYNVCDDHPATQREVYGWIARHFAGPLPPDGPPAIASKRGLTNKRVSNAKLKASGWSPAYPDFSAALTAGAVSL